MNRFVAAMFLLFYIIMSPAYAMDKIIAIVNGDLVTEQERTEFDNVLKYKLSTQYTNPEEAYEKFAEAQEDSLNNLIEDRLILNKAKEQEYEIDEATIEKRLKDFQAQYPSEDVFEADLVQRGLSVDVLRKKIVDQILMKQVVAHKVNSEIGVKPHEITEYYTTNIDKFTVGEKVEYKALVFGEIAAADDASKTLTRAYQDGALSMVIDQHNQAIRKGELEKSTVMDELAVLFDDKDKVVYEPISVGEEFYVFAITKRIPESKIALADAHGGISNFLYQKKYQKKFKEWVETLKEEAVIEIKDN